MILNESQVEAPLSWFGELGFAVEHGPDITLGKPVTERDSFGDVVLLERLRETIRKFHTAIPSLTLATLCDMLLSGKLSPTPQPQ